MKAVMGLFALVLAQAALATPFNAGDCVQELKMIPTVQRVSRVEYAPADGGILYHLTDGQVYGAHQLQAIAPWAEGCDDLINDRVNRRYSADEREFENLLADAQASLANQLDCNPVRECRRLAHEFEGIIRDLEAMQGIYPPLRHVRLPSRD